MTGYLFVCLLFTFTAYKYTLRGSLMYYLFGHTTSKCLRLTHCIYVFTTFINNVLFAWSYDIKMLSSNILYVGFTTFIDRLGFSLH